MKNTRVLITGGAGFIGSNFVRHIFSSHPDYSITILDALTYCGNIENIPVEIREDARFSFRHGSVLDGGLVTELVAGADVVVHFAAETHVTRSLADAPVFFDTNVIGTRVLAEAISNAGSVERFIHISTSEVYGTARRVPMNEEHPLNPTTPYAASKAGADCLVYAYCITYGMPAVIIRPFNAYGPGQHPEKVIPRFITSALQGKP